MARYEDDARMVGMNGTTVLNGHEAIRENWSALLSFGGRMTPTTRYAIDMSDIALPSDEYTVIVGDDAISGAPAEVVRRQPDGS